MPLRLGDLAPDFTADTTEGTVSFHEWLGGGWGVRVGAASKLLDAEAGCHADGLIISSSQTQRRAGIKPVLLLLLLNLLMLVSYFCG